MDIKGFFDALLQGNVDVEVVGMEEEETETLGSVSEDVIAQLHANDEALEKLHDDMHDKIAEYASRLHDEHLPECKRLKDDSARIFDEIVAELDLTEEQRERGIMIDKETGEITIEKPKEQE